MGERGRKRYTDMNNHKIGLKGCKIVCEIINRIFNWSAYPRKSSGRFDCKGDLANLPKKLKPYSIEVKNTKSFKLKDWVIQSKEQAKQEGKEWMLIISLDQMEGSKECIVCMDFEKLCEVLK